MLRTNSKSSPTQVVYEEQKTEDSTTPVSRRWKTCNPGRLDNQDICDLFVELLGSDVDDTNRQKCIDKIKEYKEITGSYLLSISNNVTKLDDLNKKLNLQSTYEKCFNEMMGFIISRHRELSGSTKEENKETSAQKKADQTDSQVSEQAPTSGATGSVIGVHLNIGKNLKAKTGNIHTTGEGNVSGLIVHVKDDATLDIGEVTTHKGNKNN